MHLYANCDWQFKICPLLVAQFMSVEALESNYGAKSELLTNGMVIKVRERDFR